jgi:hypothetical protein
MWWDKTVNADRDRFGYGGIRLLMQTGLWWDKTVNADRVMVG